MGKKKKKKKNRVADDPNVDRAIKEGKSIPEIEKMVIEKKRQILAENDINPDDYCQNIEVLNAVAKRNNLYQEKPEPRKKRKCKRRFKETILFIGKPDKLPPPE